jgi:hypothetical protein
VPFTRLARPPTVGFAGSFNAEALCNIEHWKRRGYRLPPTKYKFLIDGGTRAFVSFFRLWDGGPSGDVPMVATNARNATDKYRAKAYELLSLAERAGDPAQRADLLRFARMWLTLTERIEELPLPKLPYEL